MPDSIRCFHCGYVFTTEDLAALEAIVEIWFAADVDAGRPGNGYPFDGEVGGTPYTHPDYDPNAFFIRDVGVVVLDEPYYSPNGEYGELPGLDQLDALKTRRGLQDVNFTAVGYGLQQINPVFVESARVRMLANPHLIQINVLQRRLRSQSGFELDFAALDQ